jgi:hypothetical protein
MAEWLTNPERWRQRPLTQQLELLRKHYGIGPCGQSSAVLATRAVTNACIREAISRLSPLETQDNGDPGAADGK